MYYFQFRWENNINIVSNQDEDKKEWDWINVSKNATAQVEMLIVASKSTVICWLGNCYTNPSKSYQYCIIKHGIA